MLHYLLSLPGLHYMASRFGPLKLRKLAFDSKYLNGSWCFNETSNRDLISIVEKYVKKGHILHLGCGTATLAAGLDQDTFATLLGLDLSPVAVEIAQKSGIRKANFQVGDMETFESSIRYSVILYSEAIYYIDFNRLLDVLKRQQAMLTPHGVFVVTISQSDRYSHYLSAIRHTFKCLEDRQFTNSKRHLLVFN